MPVGGGKNQGLAAHPGAGRIDVSGDFHQHGPVESFGDDGPVEILHVEIHIVFQGGRIHLFRFVGLEHLHLVPFLQVDALPGQFRLDLHRGIMVDEIPVDHRFPVGILVNGPAEDFRGLESRSGGEADLHPVEIVQHPAVLALVSSFVPVKQFPLAHLPVQEIAPVGFVHDHQVESRDGRHRIISGSEQPADHALDGGNLDPGLRSQFRISQLVHGIDLVQGLQFFQLHFGELPVGLFPQGVPVHQVEDPAEPAAFQEAIDQSQDHPGLAGAGGHGQQDFFPSLADGFFGLFHRFDLVGIQVETVWIFKDIVSQGFQGPVFFGDIPFQQGFDPIGAHPSQQGLGGVVRLPHIPEPDAACHPALADKGSSVGSKEQGYLVVPPLAHQVFPVLVSDVGGVFPALIVQHGADVLEPPFGLDDPHQLFAHKQGVIGPALFPGILFRLVEGIRGPFGNGPVVVPGGTGALGVGHLPGIHFPSHLAQLLIDEIAGFRLADVPVTGSLAILLHPLFLGHFGSLFGLPAFGTGELLFFRGQRMRHRDGPGLHGPGAGRRFAGHHKGLFLVAVISVGGHEPAAEAMGHLQAEKGILF